MPGAVLVVIKALKARRVFRSPQLMELIKGYMVLGASERGLGSVRACLSSAVSGRAQPSFDALCPSPHPGLRHLGITAAPSLVPSACLGLSSPLPERHGLCLESLAQSSPPAWASPRLCAQAGPATCPDAPPRRPGVRLRVTPPFSPGRSWDFAASPILLGPWSDFSTAVFFPVRTHIP